MDICRIFTLKKSWFYNLLKTHQLYFYLFYNEKIMQKLTWKEKYRNTCHTRVCLYHYSCQWIIPLRPTLFIRHCCIFQSAFTVTILMAKSSTSHTSYMVNFNSKSFYPHRNTCLQPAEEKSMQALHMMRYTRYLAIHIIPTFSK